MPHNLRAIIIGISFCAAIVAWVISAWSYYKAISLRRPEISRARALCWAVEITFGRNVYLEDLFTDAGRTWLRRSALAVAAFLLAWAIGFAVVMATR